MSFNKLYNLFRTLALIVRVMGNPVVKKSKPIIYARLTDARCGKYMFNLLAFFLLCNYEVHLFPNIRFLSSLLPYKKLLFQFPSLKISFCSPKSTRFYISTSHNTESKDARFLGISYQYFDANQSAIIMPYPMSAQHYSPSLISSLQKLRANVKQVGVFFSGNQNEELYTNPIISTKFKKVNRIRLLGFLKANIPNEYIEIITNEFTSPGNHLKKFVLKDWKWSPQSFENQKARIVDSQWLTQLSHCNFFLACPGMVMPMCHNIIEAMAVGAIPITQYADEFYPPLSDGLNCLTFGDENQAKEKIIQALNMSADSIVTMQKAVIRYYEQYLSPLAFIHLIENNNQPNNTIIMNAEQLSVL